MTDQRISNLNELFEFAKNLSKTFSARQIVLLDGPLGAGKTEFVKAVAKALGAEFLGSPTFSLHHRLKGQSGVIEHFDLYRLESEEDLETVGLWDLFREDRGLILIEWAERLNIKNLPRNWPCMHLRFAFGPDQQRKVTVSRF